MLLLATATPAFAQVPPTPPATPVAPEPLEITGDTVTLGAGVVLLPDYEGSDSSRFSPAPGAIGSVSGYNFVLAGNRFSVDVIRDGTGPGIDLQFGPIGVLNLNRSGVKGIDDPRVRALGKRGTAIELGGFVGIGKTGVVTSPYDRLSISVSYRHDVNGAHGSGIWQPTINYTTPLSRKAIVGLFVSGERAGRGYADNYFTVTPAEAVASGLPAYRARAGRKNYTLGAVGAVSLTGDLLHGWKLVAGGTYSRLLNGFSASPVVAVAGKPNQWFGALGVAYTF
jgi:MipA family protein